MARRCITGRSVPSRSEATLLKKPADGSRDAVVLAKVSSRAYITSVDPTETAVIVDAVSSSSDRGDILRVVLGASTLAGDVGGIRCERIRLLRSAPDVSGSPINRTRRDDRKSMFATSAAAARAGR